MSRDSEMEATEERWEILQEWLIFFGICGGATLVLLGGLGLVLWVVYSIIK